MVLLLAFDVRLVESLVVLFRKLLERFFEASDLRFHDIDIVSLFVVFGLFVKFLAVQFSASVDVIAGI